MNWSTFRSSPPDDRFQPLVLRRVSSHSCTCQCDVCQRKIGWHAALNHFALGIDSLTFAHEAEAADTGISYSRLASSRLIERTEVQQAVLKRRETTLTAHLGPVLQVAANLFPCRFTYTCTEKRHWSRDPIVRYDTTHLAPA